jgi:serine/threonine-protein kinase
MELIEGETLADRLRRGPMPVGETLTIAIQIAEALEAAHEKGVVHRDLKPANVKIEPDGQVKVLDFGLAKVMENETASGSGANSPTLSMMATQAGLILGTAAYMSPEQAKGFPADHRSDVFSFGTVLYEMLAGRRAFQGDTPAETMAAVLMREPDFAALPSNLNPRLLELLRRCLDKNARRRWQAAGDLRAEIEAIRAAPPPAAVSSSPAPRPFWIRATTMAMTGARKKTTTEACQPTKLPIIATSTTSPNPIASCFRAQ